MVGVRAGPDATYRRHVGSGAEQLLLDHLPDLARLAVQLTGEPRSAADLLVRSAGDIQRQSRRFLTSDLPAAEFRTAVVRRFLRDGWRQASDRRTRACLVLTFGEGLTRAEVAGIVEVPVSTVPSARSAVASEATAELTQLVTLAPATEGLRERVLGSGRERAPRRWRRALVVTAGTAVVLAAVTVPAVVLPRLPREPRQPGTWALVHEVRPSDRWRVLERTLTPEMESTSLSVGGSELPDQGNCAVIVFVRGAFDRADLVGDVTSARVNGRPGLETVQNELRVLAWEFGTDAWAVVSCSKSLGSGQVYEIADAVRFRPSSILLPFDPATPPPGYRVSSATDSVAGQGADVILAKDDLRAGDANVNITFAQLDQPTESGSTRPLRINGRAATLDNNSENPRLCVAEQGRFVCLAGYWPDGNWPERPAPLTAAPVLIEVARGLRFAPDLADRATWFRAEDVLG